MRIYIYRDIYTWRNRIINENEVCLGEPSNQCKGEGKRKERLIKKPSPGWVLVSQMCSLPWPGQDFGGK
jgi:hypothetical protein